MTGQNNTLRTVAENSVLQHIDKVGDRIGLAGKTKSTFNSGLFIEAEGQI
jgi:hypothetical protein